MKAPEGDDVLRALLRGWKIQTPLPPRFEEEVWRRIEGRRTQQPAGGWARGPLGDWIGRIWPRPALAIAYGAVLLAMGAGLGWRQAQHETSRVRQQLSARYVLAVDPFLSSR